MSQIHEYISSGKTPEALELLVRNKPDAILLQARYNQGRKQYNMGLIDHREWDRIQAQINYAVLELAGSVTVVNRVSLTYITYLQEKDVPGNELALFNEIFRSLKKMLEDRHYPLEEIKLAVNAFDKHIGLPELVDEFEDFNKSRYTGNTEAFKTEARKQFVERLVEMQPDFVSVVTEIVETRQRETGWKEGWDLFLSQPTPDRWANALSLIDYRLNAPIFSDDQRQKWADLSDLVSEIPKTMLWRHNFNRVLPDLKRWIGTNLH